MNYDPKADQDRPYIGKVWLSPWTIKSTRETTPGIALGGTRGISAHLTKAEAYTLANDIVDAADKLPEATTAPATPRIVQCGQAPLYTSRTLINASGDVEQPLPNTPAD